MLLARGVKFAPARSEFGERATVLMNDIKTIGIHDPKVVLDVFDTIGRTFSDWPDTALVLRLLKPKPVDTMHRMLAPPAEEEKTEEQWNAGRDKIAELKRQLRHKQVLDEQARRKRAQERKVAIEKFRREKGLPPSDKSIFTSMENLIEQAKSEGIDTSAIEADFFTVKGVPPCEEP